ncbi:MAG TPA: acetylglutamate kinase [Planctomycetaceae bacterium]|jgi:acetylglutamate kinase|nr:acetylglutamate kinase [Rhodopirellula sp.]MCH2361240.1 acetylglutamate kinase [Pirellulales bacterium]HAL13433.1 acetylglutamate kinase [Planctomycetaceae bacterium]HCK70846.1 acetylglutamate kinase [Planctomycetaceae bacterium]HCP83826.1 acetylglutamate kinase [Planctomycetaceae bacterium]|tara:strand:- start:843 stop:1718 length:876 start_codon:yes stop_codon:yes gene_type:complete
MQHAIEKADTLIEALGWIRQFRGKTTVIKLGGSLLQDEAALRHVLLDIVFMETVGMRPVIVHGGGAAISKEMDTAGIAPEFIHGRRVTNDQTLEIVEKVLAGDVNRRLAELIEEVGGRSMTLNFESTPVLFGEKTTVRVSDEDVDLGWVGRVTDIDRVVIENLCYAETVPVIPSMCIDDDGQKYNVNADTAATVVAQLLGAEKLVFLSDVNGVLLDEDDESSRIESLTADRARELIANGTITGGMIPKVEACLETLDRGVGKVHIIDGSIRHSVLLEVYTTDGIGTQIVKQ